MYLGRRFFLYSYYLESRVQLLVALGWITRENGIGCEFCMWMSG